MFIGDSWTGGADAPQGMSYPDALLRRMNNLGPKQEVRGINLGKGSLNSAEALLVFLEYQRKVRPKTLIALVGINNLWNTEDIDLVRDRLRAELNQPPVPKKSGWSDHLRHMITRLKVARGCRIIYYRLVEQRQMVGPPPFNSYLKPYFDLHGQDRAAEGRQYLVKNLDRASSYDDFYRVMLYSFSYDLDAVKKYLQEQSAWKPELIRYKFDLVQRNRRLQEKLLLLEEHIKALKLICDRNGISLIIQNYPHLNPAVASMDEALRDIAARHHIEFVDQYTLFKKELGIERWKSIMTHSHVNSQGYAIMAENLLRHSAILNNIVRLAPNH
jgi:lysophospholipase L1-like esterase